MDYTNHIWAPEVLESEAAMTYNKSVFDLAREKLPQEIRQAKPLPQSMIPDEYKQPGLELLLRDILDLSTMSAFIRDVSHADPSEDKTVSFMELGLAGVFNGVIMENTSIIYRQTSLGSYEIHIESHIGVEYGKIRNTVEEITFLNNFIRDKGEALIFISTSGERWLTNHLEDFTEVGSKGKKILGFSGNVDYLVRHGRNKYFSHSYAGIFPLYTSSGDLL